MTGLALAVVVAASIVVAVIFLVRGFMRSTSVDLTNVTVSRQWLMRHNRLLDHDG